MGQTSAKPTIMIVDDESSNIDVMYEILKDEYTVMAFLSAEIALGALSQGRELPQLVLLDVNMPKMNGYELCRHIKANENTKDIPVIFLTAKDQEEDEILGFEIGAADYITKPFRPAKTKARLKTHIALRQKGEQLKAKISELEKSIRVFENKITRPTSIKKIGKRILDESDANDFSKIFLDDHVMDFADLEDVIDSKVSLMCMRNMFLPSELDEVAYAIGRYGEILTLYPDFITLGRGLKEFSNDLHSIDKTLCPKNIKMALECLETLSFTLLHWRKQLFSGILSDPNAYDKSLLADIKIILNILSNKQTDEESEDVEFF